MRSALAIGGCSSADESVLEAVTKPEFHEKPAAAMRSAEIVTLKQPKKAAVRGKSARRR